MVIRRGPLGVLVALLLPPALLLTGVPSATAEAPTLPPGCAQTDPSLNCVHAPTRDIAALPSPTFTSTYDVKKQVRTVTVNAAFPAPYHLCPAGAVAYAQLPCSQGGFSLQPRVYVPGGTAAADNNGMPLPGETCVWTCTETFTLGPTYHGPATVILSYTLGEILATATNDLSTSTYENTITVPTDPFIGSLKVTKPTVVFAGKLKTQTIKLAGRGGIPRSGVGGVLAIITASGGTEIKDGQDFIGDGQPMMEAINGTSVRLVKVNPGTVSITTVGWWASTPTDTGSLMHKYYVPLKLPVKGKALILRKWGVPADASGVLLNVSAPRAASRVGGLLVPRYQNPELVLVPLAPGAKLALNKLGKGTSLTLAGYVSPVQPVDNGLPFNFVTAPEAVGELISNFPPSAG